MHLLNRVLMEETCKSCVVVPICPIVRSCRQTTASNCAGNIGRPLVPVVIACDAAGAGTGVGDVSGAGGRYRCI